MLLDSFLKKAKKRFGDVVDYYEKAKDDVLREMEKTEKGKKPSVLCILSEFEDRRGDGQNYFIAFFVPNGMPEKEKTVYHIKSALESCRKEIIECMVNKDCKSPEIPYHW